MKDLNLFVFERVYVVVRQPDTKPEQDRWWPRIVGDNTTGA